MKKLKLGALWKFRRLNQQTELPWGARISLCVQDVGSSELHHFRISHSIDHGPARSTSQVVVRVSHNIHSGRLGKLTVVPQSNGPKGCGEYTLLEVCRPVRGDVIFISAPWRDHFQGAIFRWTDRKWQPVPYMDHRPFVWEDSGWRLAIENGEKLNLTANGEGFWEEDIRTLSLPHLSVTRENILDTVGGWRGSVHTLRKAAHERLNAWAKEKEAVSERLLGELANASAKLACVEQASIALANAAWETKEYLGADQNIEAACKAVENAFGYRRLTRKGRLGAKGTLVPQSRLEGVTASSNAMHVGPGGVLVQ